MRNKKDTILFYLTFGLLCAVIGYIVGSIIGEESGKRVSVIESKLDTLSAAVNYMFTGLDNGNVEIRGKLDDVLKRVNKMKSTHTTVVKEIKEVKVGNSNGIKYDENRVAYQAVQIYMRMFKNVDKRE